MTDELDDLRVWCDECKGGRWLVRLLHDLSAVTRTMRDYDRVIRTEEYPCPVCNPNGTRAKLHD